MLIKKAHFICSLFLPLNYTPSPVEFIFIPEICNKVNTKREEEDGKKMGTGILFAAHPTYQLKKRRGQVVYLIFKV